LLEFKKKALEWGLDLSFSRMVNILVLIGVRHAEKEEVLATERVTPPKRVVK